MLQVIDFCEVGTVGGKKSETTRMEWEDEWSVNSVAVAEWTLNGADLKTIKFNTLGKYFNTLGLLICYSEYRMISYVSMVLF